MYARAEKKQKFALQGYAHDIGLAYQIRDDLLDVTSTAKKLGKKVNKDKKAGKKNFVSILGIDRSKKQLEFQDQFVYPDENGQLKPLLQNEGQELRLTFLILKKCT